MLWAIQWPIQVLKQTIFPSLYRAILRENGCLELLLQQLKSPSLTIVSNACGALCYLSARFIEDQRTLWDLGAVTMLQSLKNSKHKTISTYSLAALKNLYAARPSGMLNMGKPNTYLNKIPIECTAILRQYWSSEFLKLQVSKIFIFLSVLCRNEGLSRLVVLNLHTYSTFSRLDKSIENIVSRDFSKWLRSK